MGILLFGMPERIQFTAALSSNRRSGAAALRTLIGLAFAALLVVVGFSDRRPNDALGAQADADTRPNVLLIVADDMRADGLWAMPEVTRLAERGLTFTRAFVTTPVCCPSRASILTGLYARHHGVLTNDPPDGGVAAFDDSSTLATWAQAAGIRTGLVGRYLNGYESLAIPPGWDDWFAIWQNDEADSAYYRYRANDRGVRRYFGSDREDHITRVLGARALAFLDEQPTRPFLLALMPRAPHYPAVPEPEDSGFFKDRELPLPPSYGDDDMRGKPRWMQDLSPLSEREREDLERFRRRQLETLLGLDRTIGTILARLREDGRLERTWIIFTSDNGLTIGEHRLQIGKSCPYEECVRVPLVIVPPRAAAAGRTEERLVGNIDLAPTIAALLGLEPDAPVDGTSLLPLVDDRSEDWRDALVLEVERANDGKRFVAVRTPGRKYVRYADEEEELYDELGDPYERRNLADDPAWAAEKARLAERLETLLATPPR